MSTTIELEVKKFLEESGSVSAAAQKVVERLKDFTLSEDDRLALWNFLYQGGFYQELLATAIERIESKNRIPWGLFIEILGAHKIAPRPEVLESVFKGVRRQEAQKDLWAAKSWDLWDRRFYEMREKLEKQFVEVEGKYRENLLEKFHFLSSQRIQDQAGRVLKRLVFLYPDDPEIRELEHSHKEEWARDIISARSPQSPLPSWESTLTDHSPTDKTMLEMFLEEARNLVIDQREIGFDVAIAFLFLSEPNRAIEILEYAPPSASTDWLRAELLLSARRHVELLDHLAKVEVKYMNDPETTFAVSYLRAIALYELGQQARAIEILHSITQVRSHYRSAHHLLLEWTQNARQE